jgi:hypothetical protein
VELLAAQQVELAAKRVDDLVQPVQPHGHRVDREVAASQVGG